MVAPSQARRRSRIAGCLRCFAGLGLALWLLALPAPLAKADPYSPPGIGSTEPIWSFADCRAEPEASESEDAVVVELRELRRDLAATCVAVAQRVDEANHRLWWSVSETAALRDQASGFATDAQLLNVVQGLEAIEQDLVPLEGAFPVEIAGQAKDLQVIAPTGVEVSNPPDVAAVQAAVLQGTETGNQNLWSLAGLAAGGVLLVVFWRIARAS